MQAGRSNCQVACWHHTSSVTSSDLGFVCALAHEAHVWQGTRTSHWCVCMWPMLQQEIRDKYPPWLEQAAAAETPENMQRYKAQYAAIQAVCQQYETDPANFARLVELIQEVRGGCTAGC